MRKFLLLCFLVCIAASKADDIEVLHDYHNVVENSDSAGTSQWLFNQHITTSNKIYSFVTVGDSYNSPNVLSVIDKNKNNGKVIEELKDIDQGRYRSIVLKDQILYLFIERTNGMIRNIEVWGVDTATDIADLLTVTDVSNVPSLKYEAKHSFVINNKEILIQSEFKTFSIYNTNTASFRTLDVLQYTVSVDDENSFGLNNNIIIHETRNEQVSRVDPISGNTEVLVDNILFMSYLGIFDNRGYFLGTTEDRFTGCCRNFSLYSTDGHSVRTEYEGFAWSRSPKLKIQRIGDMLFLMQADETKKLLYKDVNETRFNSISSSFTFAGNVADRFRLTEHNGRYYLLGRTSIEGSSKASNAIIEIDLSDGYKIIAEQEINDGEDRWVLLFKDGDQLSLVESVYKQVGFEDYDPLISKCYRVDLSNDTLIHTDTLNNFFFISNIDLSSHGYVFAKSYNHGIEPRHVSCLDSKVNLIKDFNPYLVNGGANFTFAANTKKTVVLYKSIFESTEDLFVHDGQTYNQYDVTSLESENYGFFAKLHWVDNDYLYLKIKVEYQYQFDYYTFALNLETGDLTFLTVDFGVNYDFHRGDIIRFVNNANDNTGVIQRMALDRQERIRVPDELRNFKLYERYVLAYGKSNEPSHYLFLKIEGDQTVEEFFIPCTQTCELPLVESDKNIALISNAEQGVLGDYYVYQFDKSEEPFKISQGYPGDTVLLTSNGDLSLLLITEYDTESTSEVQYLYTFNHEEKGLKKIYTDFGNFTKVMPLGKNYIGITENKKLILLDQEFNLVNEATIPNVELYENLSNDTYFECDNGTCYISLEESTLDGIVTSLIKVNANLDMIEVVNKGTKIHSTVDKKNDYFLLDAENMTSSREIYRLNRVLSDVDTDGMDDDYEIAFGFDPNNPEDATFDTDNDGVNNLREYKERMNPLKTDTDSDGYTDGEEINSGMNPLEFDLHLVDNDNDGLSLRVENEIGTDDFNTDTDGDGVSDFEDSFPLDASEFADTDGDGIGNYTDLDDDNDGMPDSWETRYRLNPNDPSDRDGDIDLDGISNYQEYVNGTDPRVANNRSSNDSSGGGSTPIWLLMILFTYIGIRNYRR